MQHLGAGVFAIVKPWCVALHKALAQFPQLRFVLILQIPAHIADGSCKASGVDRDRKRFFFIFFIEVTVAD